MARIEHDFMYRLDDKRQCRICLGIVKESLPTDCPGDKMPDSMGRDIRSGRLDFVEDRWTAVTPMQQIIDGEAKGIDHPPVGSRWAHENGNQYTVLVMANVNTTKPTKFPVIVVYRNQYGKVHTRKLAYWHESMSRDTGPCRDEPGVSEKYATFTPAQDTQPVADGPEHVCKYCGMPSYVDPSDQSAPPDYCHPEDHGSPDDANDVCTSSDAIVEAIARLDQWRNGNHPDATYRADHKEFAVDVLTLLSDRRRADKEAQRAWIDDQTQAALKASMKALLTPAGTLRIKHTEEAIEQINKVMGPA